MMIFESLAIIAIVLAMAFIFLRAKKKEYFWSMLPLTILPFIQIITKPIVALLKQTVHIRPISVSVCMVFIALIAESILIGLAANALHSKKQKTTYLLLCGSFSLVLAMIFILNDMKVFLTLTSSLINLI